MVKAEALAMRLAAFAGLRVAPVDVVEVAGRDVILVERFDRAAAPQEGGLMTRRAMVSALTWSGEAELSAHHIAYTDLAEILRKSARDPKRDLRELYRRMVFNILVGNTDDHARNNAKFCSSLHFTSRVIQPKSISFHKDRTTLTSFAVSSGCYFEAGNGIEIGENFLFAPGIKLISTNHDPLNHGQDKPKTHQSESRSPSGQFQGTQTKTPTRQAVAIVGFL